MYVCVIKKEVYMNMNICVLFKGKKVIIYNKVLGVCPKMNVTISISISNSFGSG